MKLKTLKDICKPQLGQPKSNAILKEFEKEIKTEAIEWVKFYEGNNDLAAAGAVGHFCNITEEDLE